MRLLCAAALLLLAPASGKQWSKQHSVGMVVPSGWEILERDKDRRAFVIDGPTLGPGRPRVVLWHVGRVDAPLGDMADVFARKNLQRPGWRQTTKKRVRIGAFPAWRFGYAFTEKGNGKGRARVTVALLGARVFVLEMSAALSYFPSSVYDRMEQSLEVPHVERRLGGEERALVLRVPDGWSLAVEGEDAWRVEGPSCGVGRVVLFLSRGTDEGPALAGPGPAVTFLEKKRATDTAERDLEDDLRIRMLRVRAEGWTAVAMMPLPLWEDLFPVVEQMLAGAKADRKAPPGR